MKTKAELFTFRVELKSGDSISQALKGALTKRGDLPGASRKWQGLLHRRNSEGRRGRGECYRRGGAVWRAPLPLWAGMKMWGLRKEKLL